MKAHGMTEFLGRAALLLFLAVAFAAASISAHAAQPAVVSIEQFLAEPEAASTAVQLQGIRGSDGGPIEFLLEPFEVWAPDLRLLIVEDDGVERPLERPRDRYFRGEIVGRPGSRVFLAVDPDGEVFGLVDRLMGLEVISAQRDAGGSVVALALAPVDLGTVADGREFRCDQDQLPPIPEEAIAAADGLLDGEISAPPKLPEVPGSIQWRARVAIETDFQFFQRFPNAQAATTYVGNLIGYSSTMYGAQVDTELQVSYLRLWNTSNDPWAQTSTACALFEFGKYWNDNMAGESRTIAHMLSGKNMGGGVAWLGVLCSGAFNVNVSNVGCPAPIVGTSNFGGAYGLSANIVGNFNPDNPTAVWDIVVVAHEIGHNFNSPHTHCYGGINGNPAPVDQCWGNETGPGCFNGPPSLPGPQGQGSGTIMSYCHLQPGGQSNIGLTLGQGHPFGVAPERVPMRMRDHVELRANANPACLATGATPAPAAPQTTAGTAVGNTGFTANWTRPSGSTGFVLDVSTQANFASFVPGFQGLAVGAVQSHGVTGLSQGTTYYYRVRATNAGGSSANSNVTIVTTAGGAPQTRIIRLTGNLGFGDVPVGSSAERTLTIHNDGTAALSVTGIDYPSEVFSGDWSGNVPAGGSRSVTVSFSPAAAQGYSGAITVSSNATSGTNTRAISGTGVEPPPERIIRLTGNLNFGEIEVGSSETRNLRIHNDGTDPLDVSAINYPAEVFSGNWQGGTVAPGGSRLVVVTFAPTEAQNYSGEVSVDSNATSGTNTRAISASGVLPPTRIIRLTGELDFGQVEVGSSDTRELVIHNDGNAALDVSGITFPAEVFAGDWDGGEIEAGGSRTVEISFAPTEAQSYEGEVVVDSDATSGTNTRAISGTGVEPPPERIIRLTGNLNFGGVAVGSTETRSFRIHNDGSDPLEVSAITFPADVFSGDWDGGTIAPGSSRRIFVTFAPTEEQPYSGEVVVDSNATSGTNTRAISGTGLGEMIFHDQFEAEQGMQNCPDCGKRH